MTDGALEHNLIMNPRRANIGHVLLDSTFLLANGTLAEGTNIPAYELAVDDVHVIWDDSADNTFTIEVTLNTSIDTQKHIVVVGREKARWHNFIADAPASHRGIWTFKNLHHNWPLHNWLPHLYRAERLRLVRARVVLPREGRLGLARSATRARTWAAEAPLFSRQRALRCHANHIYRQTNVTFARFQELELKIYDLMDRGGIEGSWEATGKFWPLPPSRSRNPFRRHASVMEERRYTLDVWLRMVLVFAHRRFNQAGGPPLAKALCRFLGEEAAASLRPPPLPPKPYCCSHHWGKRGQCQWQEISRRIKDQRLADEALERAGRTRKWERPGRASEGPTYEAADIVHLRSEDRSFEPNVIFYPSPWSRLAYPT